MEVKIKYKEDNGWNDEGRMNDSCFDMIMWNDGNIESISYFARNRVGRKIGKFWVKFLATFLTGSKWDAEVSKTRITYRLFPSHKRSRDLFYLTAFRYIEKFPAFADELYKATKGTLDENTFKLFQKMHLDLFQGKEEQIRRLLRYKNSDWNGLDYYGLMGPIGNTHPSRKPIGINRLKARLKGGVTNQVCAYIR